MDLKQLMSPEFQQAQARYENYRIAVDKAYKMAESLSDWNSYKFHSNSLDGVRLYTIEDASVETRMRTIVDSARALIPSIYEDMEKAISLLDDKEDKDGTKTKPSTLSRPS